MFTKVITKFFILLEVEKTRENLRSHELIIMRLPGRQTTFFGKLLSVVFGICNEICSSNASDEFIVAYIQEYVLTIPNQQ